MAVWPCPGQTVSSSPSSKVNADRHPAALMTLSHRKAAACLVKECFSLCPRRVSSDRASGADLQPLSVSGTEQILKSRGTQQRHNYIYIPDCGMSHSALEHPADHSSLGLHLKTSFQSPAPRLYQDPSSQGRVSVWC